MRFLYTTEHLEFIRTNFKSMLVSDLTAAFNQEFDLKKTDGQIKSAITNNGFKCGRTGGVPKGTSLVFTREQMQYIQENYPRMSSAEVALELNKIFDIQTTSQQIRTFTKNHGIVSGRTGHFKKNHTPWNTGTKGLVKPNSGNFKKGSIPPNHKPLGHERICSKDGYILIKIAKPNPYTEAKTRYRHKHQVVWEAENGPIPEGYKVTIKDGDKLNCDIDNLELISKAELLYLNRHGYSEAPKEVRESMRVLARLETKRLDLEKTTEQNQQREVQHENQ